MKNKEKNDVQVMLFEKIQKVLPNNYTLVDEISERLEISADAAYRRIRGDKRIDIDETFALCKQYGISIDDFVGLAEKNQIRCFYMPLDLNDVNFIVYMNALLTNLKDIRKAPGSEIIISASDIPAFSFSLFKDMAFFKVFSWSKSVYSFSGKYDEFIKGLDTDAFSKCHKEMVEIYQLTPSTEIWSANTIDSFLKMLNYHYETGSFCDNKFPVSICEKLLELMDTLQLWTENGTKYPKDTPFKFYVSETGIENTFVLFKQKEKTKCAVKLFTINNLIVSDSRFCEEMDKWLRNLSQQATLISGASARDRFKFFEAQKEKIRLLIDAFE